ncbi:MAG: GNAT family N-acetyltransferase [Oscillospiraceae bacterium]|jgi:hypothetical protein|nr:GNAT family N-acetyltransferase [Oscillospiraceae bacterium]
MDAISTTERYYAHWLGGDARVLRTDGVRCVYSSERNVTQYGFVRQFDVYCWCQQGRIIISYGDRAAEKIDALSRALRLPIAVAELAQLFEDAFGVEPKHDLKFAYTDPRGVSGIAQTLGCGDYARFLDFFKRGNPNDTDIDWLREYFDSMAADGTCVGVFDGGSLVCCTDAPGMPYLRGEVQEIGINTLPAHRRRGYAAAAVTQCAANIIKLGKCPLWSCNAENHASEQLAYSVGFTKSADVLTLTL